LEMRAHIIERVVEDADRIRPGLAVDLLEGAVDDVLSNGFLAVMHQRVHELRDDDIAEFRVWQNLAFLAGVATGHGMGSPLLRPLGAVFGPALAAVLHALRIERAAYDVVAHAGQVLDATATDEHDRV